VGSSVNLALRLKYYFNINFINDKKRGRSLIHEALLNYGYSNFSLEILEFCESSEVLSREQYYLDLLNLNIIFYLLQGHVWEGCKRSPETIAKFKALSLTPERVEKLKIFN
jgi:group I intron endonuclease